MNESSSICHRLLDKAPLLVWSRDGEPTLAPPGFCFWLSGFCLSIAQILCEVISHSA